MRNFSPPDERRSQGLRTYRQTLIMSSLSCISGTKLSQHTPTSSPTGTKLSPHTHTSSPTGTKLSQHAQNCPFQPVLPQQGELCTAATTKKPSRENFVPHPAPPPGTKLSQHAQNCPFQPVLPEQGELCTARTTTPPSRENFVPHPAPNPVQNSPSAPVLQRFCEKVRPAHLKTAFFASFAPAGRIFSHTSKQQATQGEFFRAQASNKPHRANFFAHKQATSHTGRIISRTGDRTGSADQGRMR